MNEDKFLEKLSKITPNLVYHDSLLNSESIEIPIYFLLDKEGNVVIDYEDMQREFNNKLKDVMEIAK